MATTHEAATNGDWHKTGCILCSVNCGLEVQVEDGHIAKIKGDRDHPVSQGYQCQKASRLDFYQNGKNRLTSPLRRRADGSFEEVSWDIAIAEIAQKLVSIRDTHGGHALAYYGGGGQGNHMNGSYGGALRAAMKTPYIYTSLAQEKTGGFWVDGKLFGKQNCHPAEDVEHADLLMVIGANPWQSHGFPRARKVLQDIVNDPKRTLIVVDPRRTETAEKADVFLQVRPGGDAHLLLAMLGTIVQEGLEDKQFIQDRTVGYEEVAAILREIPVDDYAREAGVDAATLRDVARSYATTPKACLRTDLGLEHSPHSTLNNYLARLLYLITGHFGKPGTQVFHTAFLPLIGDSKDPEDGGKTTKVTGTREIGKLYPPNVLPLEIDTDHKDRIRGLFVDSSNPIMTGTDMQAYKSAFAKLELLVVLDVAMTETARMAHYVLPACTQFEKAEATFFNFEFPDNFFHLRKPLFPAPKGALPEPEIYRRLCVAMGVLPASFPMLTTVAKIDRKFPKLKLFPLAFAFLLKRKPKLAAYASVILYDTLGKALPAGMQSAAILWFACQRYTHKYADAVKRAGIADQGAGLADALFRKILDAPTAIITSKHRYEDHWSFMMHEDQKVHFPIPQMLDEIRALDHETADADYPFVLQAGERRAYNANTIYREEGWRKKDPHGTLKMHPEDAARLGVAEGDRVSVESRRGRIEGVVELAEEMRPGMVSLPHGYGMTETTETGETVQSGPAINILTDSNWCDEIAKTPFHKYVPVRLVPVEVAVTK